MEAQPENGVAAEDGAPPSLDADISAAEMQMMQAMGIPFGFNTTQVCPQSPPLLSDSNNSRFSVLLDSRALSLPSSPFLGDVVKNAANVMTVRHDNTRGGSSI